MPLQINNPEFGNTRHHKQRADMLKQLNNLAQNSQLKYASIYDQTHAAAAKHMAAIKNQYPEHFATLQEQNTNAKLDALNQLDFMDSDPQHANNPITRLGSEDANVRLRMPMAWADDYPKLADGKARAFYTPNTDLITMPMHTMTHPLAGGANTLTHETMHRGFNKMGKPAKDNPEHNYIYQKMRKDYVGNTPYTKQQINTSWESRPAFRYESEHAQDTFNKEQTTRFEDMARQKLGS